MRSGDRSSRGESPPGLVEPLGLLEGAPKLGDGFRPVKRPQYVHIRSTLGFDLYGCPRVAQWAIVAPFHPRSEFAGTARLAREAATVHSEAADARAHELRPIDSLPGATLDSAGSLME